jgi:hypothetical protein
MKCPHCGVHFHDSQDVGGINYRGHTGWLYRTALCPECKGLTIELSSPKEETEGEREWRQVHPIGSNRGPVPSEIAHMDASCGAERAHLRPAVHKPANALD